MNSQNAHTLLMIEPIHFGFNKETAINNAFQLNDNELHTEIQKKALLEFRKMVATIEQYGIQIIVVKDTPEPHTPDSIFPNNWIYIHSKEKMAIFPMFAENRRHERRMDIIHMLEKFGIKSPEIINYTPAELKGKFLEGTGSMVLDRENKIAYALLSPRTDCDLFQGFCKEFGYSAISFPAYFNKNGIKQSIYHTNVMMSIGEEFAVLCLDTVEKLNDRILILESLLKNNKKIIQITEEQMLKFAGNLLQLQNADGKKIIVISQTALDSLYPYQFEELKNFGEIVPISIPTIEKYGGGSVRCMIAEILF